MTRGLSATNQTEIAKPSLHVVLLAKLEFDTPVYVHSGVGTITYGGNTYLGVGGFGGIADIEESEDIIASPIVLTLSGIDSQYITEALDSGNYGDVITVYEGYRQDDGTLYDDPWVFAKGTFEFASLSLGADNSVSITARNDLSRLEEKDGSRFSDEDQRQTYAADEGFEFITDNATVKLIWGGGVTRGRPDDGMPPGPRGGRHRIR